MGSGYGVFLDSKNLRVEENIWLLFLFIKEFFTKLLEDTFLLKNKNKKVVFIKLPELDL